MAGIEELKKTYRLSPRDAKLLEPYLDDQTRLLEICYSTIERLKEFGREIPAQFLAAAVIDEKFIRLYFRLGRTIFSKDIVFNGSDAEDAIFDDISSYLFKRRHSLTHGSSLPN